MALTRVNKTVADLQNLSEALILETSSSGIKSYIDTGLSAKASVTHVHSSYAPVDSPSFTGTPLAPTQTVGNNTTRLATTAFVQNQIAQYASTVPVSSGGSTPTPTKILSGGYNALLAIVNGRLFATSGNYGSYNSYVQGRGYIGSSTQSYSDATGEHPQLVSMDTGWVLVPIVSSSPVIDIAVVGRNYFALLQNKELWAWGQNNVGELGLGHTQKIGHPTLTATNVDKMFTSATNGSFSIDNGRMFIQKTDGLIYGCGYNGYGALGNGNTTNQLSWISISPALFPANSVRYVWNLGMSYGMTLIETTSNVIYAAGYNGYGQFGNGATVAVNSTFTNVTTAWGNSGAITLATGGFGHSGTAGGTLCIWFASANVIKLAGYNGYGQLGRGNTTNSTSPVTLAGYSGIPEQLVVNAAAAPTFHLRTSTGKVYGWGYNNFNSVGNNGTTSVTSPVLIMSDCVKILNTDGNNAHDSSWYLTRHFKRGVAGAYYYSSCGWDGHGQSGQGTQGRTIPAGTDYYGNPIYTVENWATLGLMRFSLDVDGVNMDVDEIYCLTSTGTGAAFMARTANNTYYGWGYNGQFSVQFGYANNHVRSPVQIFPRFA
jgi:alpha-tubulin suppressor-like RCC1 family protein